MLWLWSRRSGVRNKSRIRVEVLEIRTTLPERTQRLLRDEAKAAATIKLYVTRRDRADSEKTLGRGGDEMRRFMEVPAQLTLDVRAATRRSVKSVLG